MEVASLGTSEVSVGNISISSTNGAATVATTFEYIKAGGNRSLSGRYKIPAGKEGNLVSWRASAISATMDSRIRATVFANDRAISTVYHFRRMFLASGQILQHSFLTDAGEGGQSMPAGTVVKVSAIPGSAPAGNKLDCDFVLDVLGE